MMILWTEIYWAGGDVHSANCVTKVFPEINATKSNSGLTTMKTALETEAWFFKIHHVHFHEIPFITYSLSHRSCFWEHLF